jgi:pilus assembly protein CpaC
VGNTTILIWHGESVSRFELTVQPDLSEIQRELRATLPNEQINVSSSKDSILLTGVASSSEVVRRAGEIASTHSKTVVNLLQAPKTEPRQVMLQVKFASIDRDALTHIGANIFSTNNKLLGSLTTQQFNFPRLGQLQLQQGTQGQPVLGSEQVTVSDMLNLFAFRPDLNVGATIAMLKSLNVLQILAEPNLIAISGHEASFLAGGEFPFPVITSTGTGGNSAPVVTVQFRPFGVRLKFTPTVDANDLIHLKVEPEVSSLDFANALTIQGFLIPALSTRRAETEVDLREGESFAIAGLLDNRVTQLVSKFPGLGDIPILGQLFKTRSTEKTNSELLVVITPRFVKPFSPGEKVPLPKFPVKMLDGQRPDQSPAPPKFVGPRGHESAPAPDGGPAK